MNLANNLLLSWQLIVPKVFLDSYSEPLFLVSLKTTLPFISTHQYLFVFNARSIPVAPR